MLKGILIGFSLLVAVNSGALEYACWQDCADGSNSTRSCVNDCGLDSPRSPAICQAYCKARGGGSKCGGICTAYDVEDYGGSSSGTSHYEKEDEDFQRYGESVAESKQRTLEKYNRHKEENRQRKLKEYCRNNRADYCP